MYDLIRNSQLYGFSNYSFGKICVAKCEEENGQIIIIQGKLNRFRTGHGKCNNMLFHWNIRENPSCECGAEKETIQHIVEECPLTKFQQGFSKLHLLTEDALNWLQQIKNI
jgi:hypothetical protein